MWRSEQEESRCHNDRQEFGNSGYGAFSNEAGKSSRGGYPAMLQQTHARHESTGTQRNQCLRGIAHGSNPKRIAAMQA